MSGTHSLHVVLVQPVPYVCPDLAEALSAASALQLTELKGSVARIVQALPGLNPAPDVVLIYCPFYNAPVQRLAAGILDHTEAEVLLLLTDSIPAESLIEQRLGALRCPKPGSEEGVRFPSELLQQVRLLGQRVRGGEPEHRLPVAEGLATPVDGHLSDLVITRRLIAIGASTGGTEALARLFRDLPPRIPGIVVVQHMPPVFTKMYAERLNRELPFAVCEATDGVLVEPGSIHIAPGDRHLLVERRGNRFYTRLGDTEKVSGHCPSVDALFSSVAHAVRSLATGVILTGMGADGAQGMLEMRGAGAYTIGQDEASSVVYGMPRKAYENGAVAMQAPLDRIAQAIMNHLGKATI